MKTIEITKETLLEKIETVKTDGYRFVTITCLELDETHLEFIYHFDKDLDLVHFTHFSYPVFYSGRFVVTIHDLIKNQFYDKGASTRSPLGYRVKHLGYKFVMDQAINKSLTVSNR